MEIDLPCDGGDDIDEGVLEQGIVHKQPVVVVEDLQCRGEEQDPEALQKLWRTRQGEQHLQECFLLRWVSDQQKTQVVQTKRSYQQN